MGNAGIGKKPYKKRDSKETSFKKKVGSATTFKKRDTGATPYKKRNSGAASYNNTGNPQKQLGDLVRLNKYIANSGICSRREADEYIKAGLIKVNGVVVTEMGIKVGPTDEVKYNDSRIKNERKVYVLLNKPKDYITTVNDENDRKTVMELIGNACKERIYPVGRLDRNTTGLLLLTNDGDLAKKITHPKYEKKKIYLVSLDKNLKSADKEKIASGINLEDGFIKADSISYANADDKKEIGVEIHSGRNRIVRRIFESLDYKVLKLDRVYYAGLTKKNLPRGKWRFLSEKEISMLKMNAFE